MLEDTMAAITPRGYLICFGGFGRAEKEKLITDTVAYLQERAPVKIVSGPDQARSPLFFYDRHSPVNLATSLRFFAQRSEFVSRQIIPLLEQGNTVVSPSLNFSDIIPPPNDEGWYTRLLANVRGEFYRHRDAVRPIRSFLLAPNYDTLLARVEPTEATQIRKFGSETYDRARAWYEQLRWHDPERTFILNGEPPATLFANTVRPRLDDIFLPESPRRAG